MLAKRGIGYAVTQTRSGRVESERRRERGEDLVRRPHITPLFEPRVPGGSDAREQRHLLATEARRPPAEAIEQADRGRRQPLATRAQEVTRLAPARAGVGDPAGGRRCRRADRSNAKCGTWPAALGNGYTGDGRQVTVALCAARSRLHFIEATPATKASLEEALSGVAGA